MLSEGYPLLFTCLMKPKSEVVNVEKVDTKIRPYIVAPLWVNMVGKVSWGFLSEVSLNFLQHEESISCVGFSWCYGGAKRLMARLQMATPGNPVFLSYGDDVVVCICLPDGTFVYCCPDVSGMDYNLSPELIGVVVQMMERRLYGNGVPAYVRNLFVAFEMIRERHRVMLGTGPESVLKISGNSSGFMGTTNINQGAIEVFYHHSLKRFLQREITTLEEARTMMSEFGRHCYDTYGLRIKPETLACEAATPEFPLPLPFLGFCVRDTPAGLVPSKRSDDDYFEAICSHNRGTSVHDGIRRSVAAIHGLYLSGGFLFPTFRKYAERALVNISFQCSSLKVEKEFVPLDERVGLEGLVDEFSLDTMGFELVSDQRLFAFYTLPKGEVVKVEKFSEIIPAHVVYDFDFEPVEGDEKADPLGPAQTVEARKMQDQVSQAREKVRKFRERKSLMLSYVHPVSKKRMNLDELLAMGEDEDFDFDYEFTDEYDPQERGGHWQSLECDDYDAEYTQDFKDYTQEQIYEEVGSHWMVYQGFGQGGEDEDGFREKFGRTALRLLKAKHRGKVKSVASCVAMGC